MTQIPKTTSFTRKRHYVKEMNLFQNKSDYQEMFIETSFDSSSRDFWTIF